MMRVVYFPLPGSAAVIALLLLATVGTTQEAQLIQPKLTIPLPGAVIDMALSADGTRMFVVTDKKEPVSLWDVATGEKVREFEGLTGRLVAMSPNGKRLAGIQGVEIQVRDVETGKITHRFPKQIRIKAKLVFSASGKTLAVIGDDGARERIGHDANQIFLWNLETNRLTTFPTRVTYQDSPLAMVFAPDGLTLYYVTLVVIPGDTRSTMGAPRSASSYRSVKKRNLQSGKDRILYEDRTNQSASERPARLYLSRDGKRLVYARNNEVHINTAEKAQQEGLTEYPYGGRALGFAPDGRTVAATYGPVVTLSDLATGESLLRLAPQPPLRGTDYVAPAFSPDSRSLVTAGVNAILVWDVDDFMKKRAAK